MNLDIETTVRTIFLMLLVGAGVLMLFAYRAFREASRLRFFLKKRALLGQAWKFVFFALGVIILAFLINGYAEPITYKIYQPSPTVTLTPTITLTPTVTETPTPTQTATITPTLEFTVTPEVPVVISQDFTSQVTPNSQATFSSFSFSRRITAEYQPIDPSITFDNPVDTIYATFSYTNMSVGVQWTALWFRNGELIYYETKPWNGSSGGYGYSDCTKLAEEWLPGDYEVQMFVGETWKMTGNFSIAGEPPTPTVTPSLTPTITSTPTITPPETRTAATAPAMSETAALKATATQTKMSSQTSAPIGTAVPSTTPIPSRTPVPSLTVTASMTPTATIVPTATRRSTMYR